jgi:hypothetical protein
MHRPIVPRRFHAALALSFWILGSPLVVRANVLFAHPFNSYTSHPASLSVVNSIGISNNGAPPPDTVYFGTIDLKNNDLIVHPAVQDEAHAFATFKSVYDMVRSGADQGAYDAAGITSSTVETDAGTTGATNAKGGLAIGVILNDDGAGNNPDGSGNPLWGSSGASDLGTFDGYGDGAGQHLTQYDTIVKYTFIGDLFLEGLVTQTDWAEVFGNLGKHPDNSSALNQAWENGDAFYQSPFGMPVSQIAWAATFANLAMQSDYPYTATLAATGGGTYLERFSNRCHCVAAMP